MRYCISCMNILNDDEDMCRFCGFDKSDYVIKMQYISAETMLENRYYIGRDLFADPFGVTYIAFDTIMERKVLIRQLLIDKNSTIYCVPDETEKVKAFVQRNSFLDFYKRMAVMELPAVPVIYTCKVAGSQQVLAVREYFERMDLDTYWRQHGPMSYQDAAALLYPVIQTVKMLHDNNMYHGNISASNIYMDANRKLYLDEFPGIQIEYKKNISGNNEMDTDVTNYRNDILNILLVLVSMVNNTGEKVTAQMFDNNYLKNESDPVPYDLRKYIYKVFDDKKMEYGVSADDLLYEIYAESPKGVYKEPERIPDELQNYVKEKNITIYKYDSSTQITESNIRE